MFPVPVSVQAPFVSFPLYIKSKFSLTSVQSGSWESSNVFHVQKGLQKAFFAIRMPMAPSDQLSSDSPINLGENWGLRKRTSENQWQFTWNCHKWKHRLNLKEWVFITSVRCLTCSTASYPDVLITLVKVLQINVQRTISNQKKNEVA